MRSYKGGDKEDFDRLYNDSYPQVFRTLLGMLGNKEEAEDVTQEAYFLAFKAWNKFKEDAPAPAWIHRIAINTAMSFKRRERLRSIGELIKRLGTPILEAPQPLDMDLQREIAKLNPKNSSVLLLRHFHGYSNREIGELLKINESTVASRLMEAKNKLRKKLGEEFFKNP